MGTKPWGIGVLTVSGPGGGPRYMSTSLGWVRRSKSL